MLVWDASAIYHAHQADRVDVLGDIASSLNGREVEHVMTAAVAKELEMNRVPVPGWVSRIVHVDDLTELVTLTKWVGLISSAAHNRGEATALAWAEVHRAVAIVDDRAARRVARSEHVEVHGVLWVVAEAINCGHITPASGLSFVDVMLSHGARYPFGPGEFLDWARDQKLLP
jgi:predicted nucleic acid-binding protein